MLMRMPVNQFFVPVGVLVYQVGTQQKCRVGEKIFRFTVCDYLMIAA